MVITMMRMMMIMMMVMIMMMMTTTTTTIKQANDRHSGNFTNSTGTEIRLLEPNQRTMVKQASN